MPLRLPLPNAIRLWALVLLAAIGLQAAVPVGGPLQVRHGSAFSATTVDVAVAPQRRIEAESPVSSPLPAIVPVAAAQPSAPAFAALVSRPSRPDSTGPPAEDILARQPAPRAPPIA